MHLSSKLDVTGVEYLVAQAIKKATFNVIYFPVRELQDGAFLEQWSNFDLVPFRMLPATHIGPAIGHIYIWICLLLWYNVH